MLQACQSIKKGKDPKRRAERSSSKLRRTGTVHQKKTSLELRYTWYSGGP